MKLIERILEIGRVAHKAKQDLLDTEAAADRLGQKMENIHMALTTFLALLQAINTETDRLAAKIQELMDTVETGSLTGAEEEQVLNGLQAIKDRLTVIGADSNNPVPPVVDPNNPPVEDPNNPPVVDPLNP